MPRDWPSLGKAGSLRKWVDVGEGGWAPRHGRIRSVSAALNGIIPTSSTATRGEVTTQTTDCAAREPRTGSQLWKTDARGNCGDTSSPGRQPFQQSGLGWEGPGSAAEQREVGPVHLLDGVGRNPLPAHGAKPGTPSSRTSQATQCRRVDWGPTNWSRAPGLRGRAGVLPTTPRVRSADPHAQGKGQVSQQQKGGWSLQSRSQAGEGHGSASGDGQPTRMLRQGSAVSLFPASKSV